MTIKTEFVDNQKKDKIKCKCGKEFSRTNGFSYHRLRCEAYKKDGENPYPTEKMSSEEAEKILLTKHKLTNDGKWMKKLVYKCKIGEVVKISVPDHREAQRICQLWKYYVNVRKLTAVVKISKTWRGKDVFLSLLRKESVK